MQGSSMASLPDHYFDRSVYRLRGWVVDRSVEVAVWEEDRVFAGGIGAGEEG